MTGLVVDSLRGSMIYGLGDGLAALVRGEFTWTRCLGMAIIGGTLYALEIPTYFRWIDRCVPPATGWIASLRRTSLALMYFNPLWIARHLLFIVCLSGRWEAIDWRLLEIGGLSFAANIPLSATANYLIQNRMPLNWRFAASASFSATMAVYYALSEVWFG